MIAGCGIDLVKIERIEKIIKKWGNNFTSKIFTLSEREYCEKKKNKFESYAGKFAAKEALLKALDLQGINWQEIEVKNNKSGKPIISLSGNLKRIALSRGITESFISISHTKDFAIAQVILEGNKC